MVMKVYTGSGDSGKTSLFSGERIDKSDDRIEAYGAVDELNAVIGSVAAALPRHDDTQDLKRQLTRIQSDLFQVGALLATIPDSLSATHLTPITVERSQWLENKMDTIQDRLEPINGFILPNGHPSATWAHLARTVCRRVERRVIKLFSGLDEIDSSSQEIRVYLNRLSDYFFVLSRFCNLLAGVKDELWHK